MKTLIITEKPSVGRDIAKVLGRFKTREGYLENEQFIVSWAIGHLVELAEPEDYNPALKKWSLHTLPFIPGEFLLKVIPETARQFQVLKELLLSPQVGLIVNACDAGREGENIFRRIYAQAGCAREVKRLWLRETTPAAIRLAFENLRENRELDNLAVAAAARAQADWLVGINATRAFTCRHKELLSVGRVQTPTLALIVAREREIRNFKAAKYWEVWATFRKSTGETYRGKWFADKTDRFPSAEAAREMVAACRNNRESVVSAVEEKEVKEPPPLLFNLNDLQKEANQKHGLTAEQTLRAAQALYEKHKLITYPRTESRHLSALLAKTIPQRMAALAAAAEYQPLIPGHLPPLSRRYVDDARVTDHHAIIITETKPESASLSRPEQIVYDLVARRLLAIFYPDARYNVTRVITAAGKETFLSRGKVELEKGWKKVYPTGDKKDEEEQLLPPLAQGERVFLEEIDALEKQTKPPPRYTEATLLAAMEKAGKFVEDKEMQDILKAAGGIGTPATRAAIIERLIQVGYVKRQKKTLFPTAKGEALIDLVPEEVKSPELTARWEQGLLEIETGEQKPEQWLEAIKDFTAQIVTLVKTQAAAGAGIGAGTKAGSDIGIPGAGPQPAAGGNVRPEQEILGKCPLCGKDVREFPKGYGCTGWKEGCRFAIWKEIAGKKISPAQAKSLLKKGRTGVIKGFRSRAGKTFNAALALNEEGKVIFSFPRD
ncbi:MAG: DNA topoisomerase 3 [Armatimonadetes bacterium]|nr:DNA topoisomerase 3 [Armatimonadota bacterium]